MCDWIISNNIRCLFLHQRIFDVDDDDNEDDEDDDDNYNNNHNDDDDADDNAISLPMLACFRSWKGSCDNSTFITSQTPVNNPSYLSIARRHRWPVWCRLSVITGQTFATLPLRLLRFLYPRLQQQQLQIVRHWVVSSSSSFSFAPPSILTLVHHVASCNGTVMGSANLCRV